MRHVRNLVVIIAALVVGPMAIAEEAAKPVEGAKAVDPAPSPLQPLFGTWTAVGRIDLETNEPKLIPMPEGAEAVTIEIGVDSIKSTKGGESQSIPFKVLVVKPEGITLEVRRDPENRIGKQKVQIIVLPNGIVVCEGSNNRGAKFTRVDGKPVGLPPSVLIKKPVTEVKGAAGATGPAAVGAETKGVDLSRFTVQIQNLGIDQNISFQDGDTTAPNFNSSANFGMRVKWQKPIMCIGQADNVVWKEIVTDAGESLIPGKDDEHFRNRFSRNSGNGDGRETWVHGQFKAPTKPAKLIKRLAGTIPMACETTPGKPLDFKPIKDWIGNAQKIPGTNYLITILSCDDKTFKYRIPNAAQELIKDVIVQDADGTRLESRGSGSSGGNSSMTVNREFSDPIPLDGTIRFKLVGTTTVVQVPFEYTNILLIEEPVPEPVAPKF